VVTVGLGLAGCSEAWESELVSVDATGTDSGEQAVDRGVLSADGTTVAFATRSADLGPVDGNSVSDVYVRDTVAGTTTLVSVEASGTGAGNGLSSDPVISADGTIVAFVSHASDLGPTDTNGVPDVYVRDLVTGTTSLVSVAAGGADSGPGGADTPALSADGTKVLFRAGGGGYAPNDPVTPDSSQLYVRDLTAGATTLVSVNSTGVGGGDGGAYEGTISADGTTVAFTSSASDLGPTDTNFDTDVYVRHLAAGTTTLVSVAASGTDAADGASSTPVLSADGTRVAFASYANDFGPPDAGSLPDILVRDLATSSTHLVTVQPSGAAANGFHTNVRFSPDGTKVAFDTLSANLGPVDTNARADAYVRDLAAGTTTLLSLHGSGTDSANSGSGNPMFDATGTRIAFHSLGSNLGPTDNNGLSDVYVRDLEANVTSLVSSRADGTEAGNGTARLLGYAQGRILVLSSANDLGPIDTNGQADLYLASVVEDE
jgi:Tol biopolymer transport system component